MAIAAIAKGRFYARAKRNWLFPIPKDCCHESRNRGESNQPRLRVQVKSRHVLPAMAGLDFWQIAVEVVTAMPIPASCALNAIFSLLSSL